MCFLPVVKIGQVCWKHITDQTVNRVPHKGEAEEETFAILKRCQAPGCASLLLAMELQ